MRLPHIGVALALCALVACAHLGDILTMIDSLYRSPLGTLVSGCVKDALSDLAVGSCLLGPETWEQPPPDDTRERVGSLGREWMDAFSEARREAEIDPESPRARRALRRLQRVDAKLAEEIGT